jgi:hypothetical protein
MTRNIGALQLVAIDSDLHIEEAFPADETGTFVRGLRP